MITLQEDYDLFYTAISHSILVDGMPCVAVGSNTLTKEVKQEELR